MDIGRWGRKESVVRDKAFAFALRVVRLCRWLSEEKREYVLSKQLLRSGTAIGALVREAEQAESQADFIHKMSVAFKEAGETEYWVELLHGAEYLDSPAYTSIHSDLTELLRLVTAIVKTSRSSP